MAEAVGLCETAIVRRLASPRTRVPASGRCSSSGLATTTPETSRRRPSSPARTGARVGGRLAGGTMPSAGGGPDWPDRLVTPTSRPATSSARAKECALSAQSDEPERKIPVERSSPGHTAWAGRAGAQARVDTADESAAPVRAERGQLGLRIRLPAAIGPATRAAVQLAAGEPARGRAPGRRTVLRGRCVR